MATPVFQIKRPSAPQLQVHPQVKTVQPTPQNIQGRTGQTTSELNGERVVALERELRDLKAALQQAHSAWNEVASDLRKTEFDNSELLAQTQLDAEQIQILEDARGRAIRLGKELEHALTESRHEVRRLSGILHLQSMTARGLEGYKARLEQRLHDIVEELQRSEPDAPAIADLIAKDIRKINRPAFSWRLARALGVLRLAHSGAPHTIGQRKAIARDLQTGFREICQTMSSALSPAEGTAAVVRFFKMWRHARRLVQELRLPNLLRRKASEWSTVPWARKATRNHSDSYAGAELFDAIWYLGQNPDVAASPEGPMEHYFTNGANEGRNPNALFDSAWYLKKNSDVAAARINPLSHYCERGWCQGRDPHPLFSTSWYLTENPDVAVKGLNPLKHYLSFGVREGRNPHPLFDTVWYTSRNPELGDLNPLAHYISWGGRNAESPHPLFDAKWYLESYGDVTASGLDPLRHYLEFGAQEGREPHPLFDSLWYVRHSADPQGAAQNPLLHYVLVGAKRWCSPTPIFDPRFYAENCPEAVRHPDLLAHYLTVGWRAGHRPCADFDVSQYYLDHPDAAISGVEPLTHYAQRRRAHGWRP